MGGQKFDDFYVVRCCEVYVCVPSMSYSARNDVCPVQLRAQRIRRLHIKKAGFHISERRKFYEINISGSISNE